MDKNDSCLKILIDFLIYAVPMLICGYIGSEISEGLGGILGFIIGGYIGYKIDEMFEKPDSKKYVKNPKLAFKQKTNLISGSIIETHIVGVTFENRQEIIEELRMGENLVLERDSSNPYDKNAIKVSVFENENVRYWKSTDFEMQVFDTQSVQSVTKSLKKIQIGFINRELANKIAPFFDRYGFMYLPNLAKIINIRKRINGPTGIKIQFRIPNEDCRELELSLLTNLHFPLY